MPFTVINDCLCGRSHTSHETVSV